MKRSRLLLISGVVVALAAAAGAVVTMRHTPASAAQDSIPLATVTRGDLKLDVYATGELRPQGTAMVAAPTLGGGVLQITQIAQTGQVVKKGDMIVSFDPSEQNYNLDQSRSELQEAEQEIVKAKADQAVLAAQDKVALLKARYDVRKAELDVETNEILSAIDAQKNLLALDQAKRVQAETESDAKSHHDTGNAAILLAQQKYAKAKLAMDQAQQNLEKMHVTAPVDGIISLKKNMNAAGGFFFTGMALPDFHPGDQVQPGTPIAQVLDPNNVELVAHIKEIERVNIKPGQAVQVSFDALPGVVVQGTVKSVAGAPAFQWFDEAGDRKFDCIIQLKQTSARLRPGLTAHLLIEADQLHNVLSVPRQAVFSKDGKWVAFVRSNGGYDMEAVKIVNQSESRAVVEGLKEGAQVAMMDPTVARKQAPGNAAAGLEGAP
ncbi:MAG TPA: HlyD family efflux transporter periplasmic adaptor subunit [Terracidiphilus sp.]|nr:HlyD family efflux transporter periplasmic adaptor subunit [Terracidiphilus sp.]